MYRIKKLHIASLSEYIKQLRTLNFFFVHNKYQFAILVDTYEICEYNRQIKE